MNTGAKAAVVEILVGLKARESNVCVRLACEEKGVACCSVHRGVFVRQDNGFSKLSQ